jgi:hypothetical protein
VNGGSIMLECMVAIGQMSDDAVQAGDDLTAIDLVLAGQGLEISSETRDASIREYACSDPRPYA